MDPIELLHQLIATPSFSKAEQDTAFLIQSSLEEALPAGSVNRHLNNVWAKSSNWVSGRPTILLNSHHDTVRPAAGYTRDPFSPDIEGDRLYGLGSNDAGGCLVALIATFLRLENHPDLNCNLILSATAEEEISGANGIAALLPQLGEVDAAIVGEPTLLQPAIAERGLVVIDGLTKGKSGHAARHEGINALYLALEDIDAIRMHRFSKESELLGPTHATVTQINSGTQHNVVPDRCQYVIDLRVNEHYTNAAAVAELQQIASNSQLSPRSLRLSSSRIAPEHPLLKALLSERPPGYFVNQNTNVKAYGSPTLSDQALLPFPSLKLGPGDSARSHTANEYVGITEVKAAVEVYCEILLRAY